MFKKLLKKLLYSFYSVVCSITVNFELYGIFKLQINRTDWSVAVDGVSEDSRKSIHLK